MNELVRIPEEKKILSQYSSKMFRLKYITHIIEHTFPTIMSNFINFLIFIIEIMKS